MCTGFECSVDAETLVCCAVDVRHGGAEYSYAPLPLSSLVVVVAVVAMMMTPIAVTRIVRVGVVTTVVVRSPPAPAIDIADQTYLLNVRGAVCRDWRDRHCSRCGRC